MLEQVTELAFVITAAHHNGQFIRRALHRRSADLSFVLHNNPLAISARKRSGHPIRFRSYPASQSEKGLSIKIKANDTKSPQHIIKRSDKLHNEPACDTLADEDTFADLIGFELKFQCSLEHCRV